MLFLIPVFTGILFRLGGCGKDDRYLPFMNPPTPIASKWWRWIGIGVFIGLTTALIRHSAIPLIAVITYYIATNIPYGDNDKNWIRKLIGRDANWILYGTCFGLASAPVLGFISIFQAIIGGVSFYGLMKWSNDGYKKGDGYEKTYLDHAYVEICFGFLGTVLYVFSL